MQTSKDIETYLASLDSEGTIIKTICQCSMNSNKTPMVNNRKKAYDFDAVVKMLFKGDAPTSVDCICVTNKTIDFIEFKDGVIDRYDTKYKELDSTCQECQRLHRESFKFFTQTREQHKKILEQNLRMKASDSLLILQNCILPHCGDSLTTYQLRLICVYKIGDISPLDEYELGMEDLASPAKNAVTSDPEVSDSIKGQLGRYAKEDIYCCHPFYESVSVYSNLEFQELKKYK